MKLRYVALLGTTVPLSFVTHAQSSVTLYGVVDIGVTYVNNAQTQRTVGGPVGASQIAMSDGHVTGLSGSRWGLRSVEDLGGGFKAIAVLESGFMANSGALAQGGAEFGRQAYVGLSSNYGTATAGRQYDPLVDYVQNFTGAGTFAGYIGAHPDDLDNLTNTNRINNSLKFATANYGGFSAEGLYSVGGVAGNATQNQIWGLGAGYSGSGFAVGAGYLNARDPNVSFYGNNPNKGVATANNIGSFGSATSPESFPVYAGYASAKTLQILGIGASYAVSNLTLGAVATNTRFEALGSSSGPNPLGYSGRALFATAELNFQYKFTPSFQIGTAVNYTRRASTNGDDGAKYLQFDLGVDYNLSKRTDVYLLTVFQRAIGTESLGQSAVASVTGFSPSTTSKQFGERLALRHKF